MASLCTPNKLLINIDFSTVALQFGAYGLQEATSPGTIQDAMIERETQVHHVAYGDCIIFDDHRPFDNCIHAKNASVRLIDNWHRYNSAKCARVIHDEGATLQILNCKLVGTGTLGY